MEDILKIVKSLDDSDTLLKEVSETIKNESKEQKEGFISVLLGTLGVQFIRQYVSRQRSYKAGKGTARVGYGSKRSSIKRSSLKKI